MSSPSPFTSQFNWGSLLAPAASLGATILGNQVAPSTAQQSAQVQQQNANNTQAQQQFQNQLTLQKMGQAQQIRQNTMPSLYTNLGYSPDQANTMAQSYAKTPPALPTFQTTDPSAIPNGIATGTPGSAAKTAIGAGLAAAPAIPGIISAIGKIGGTAASVAAPSLSAAGAYGPTLAQLGADPAVFGATGAADAAAGGAGAAGAGSSAAGAAGATGSTGGGLGASVAGFLTNPITIGVGAAIIGITALLKSQAHWNANDLVEHVQNPFNQNLSTIVDGFDKSLQAGTLTKANAQQMRDATATAIQGYAQAVQQFASKGGQNAQVANQALADMSKYYGGSGTTPDWSKIIGKMDQEIANLPG